MNKKVLIPLAEGCEELEAVTLIDLFRRANLNVITASLSREKTIRCSRGVKLVADTDLESITHDSFDLVVLPGGLPGADNLNNDPRVHQLISKTHGQGGYVAAICAAPRILLNNVDLDLKQLTAYPGSLQHLDTTSLRLQDANIVRDRNIITSKGPGTAMDFALDLIEILLGKQARKDVEEPLCRS